MEINQHSVHTDIEDHQVTSFEQLIGYKLPVDYRDFLLRHNGGVPHPNIFKTRNKKYESDVQSLYGLGSLPSHCSLEHHYPLLKDRLPKSYLAIGNDSLGNFFLLDLKKSTIKFFDHEIERAYLIDTSFSAFLNNLYEVTYEQSKLDKAFHAQDIDYFADLIRKGVPAREMKNEFDQLITEAAALWGKVEVLKYLVEQGAGINSLLYQAAARNRLEVVQYLLSLPGIDLEERNPTVNHNTALIHASHSGNLVIVKLLIEKGADIHAVDDYGNNALDKARWSNNQELVTYLEQVFQSGK